MRNQSVMTSQPGGQTRGDLVLLFNTNKPPPTLNAHNHTLKTSWRLWHGSSYCKGDRLIQFPKALGTIQGSLDQIGEKTARGSLTARNFW